MATRTLRFRTDSIPPLAVCTPAKYMILILYLSRAEALASPP
jgi:hypothetical protein